MTVIAVFAACLAVAFWTGHTWRNRLENSLHEVRRTDAFTRDTLQRNIDRELGELRAQGLPVDPVPFGFAHGTYVGHYSGLHHAVLPASPLATLAVGLNDVAPSATRLSVDRYRYATTRDPVHPYSLRTGRFDVVFVVVYLMPLLVLVLSLSLLAGERESGTLAMLLVHRISPARLAFAKALARATLVVGLVALMAVPVLLAALSEADSAGVTRVNHPAMRGWIWLGGVVLYAAFWFVCALVIDAYGRSARSNALWLAAVWLALVVAVPSLASVAARNSRPVPSRAAIGQALATAQQQAWSLSQDSVIAMLVRRRPDVRAELSPADGLERFMAYQMFNLVVRDSIVAPIESRIEDARARRIAFADRLTHLSPALLMAGVLTDAAGTGAARHADYERQLGVFQQTWTRYFEDRIYHRSPISDLTAIPRFEYVEEPLSRLLGRTLPAFALLTGVTLIGAAFAARGYRRYGITE